MKNQYNDKGERIGYWVEYWDNMCYKGYFINGVRTGNWEWYNDGNLIKKAYRI